MNDERLAEIRAREQAATPGPWLIEPQDGSVWEAYSPQRQIAHCQSKPGVGMMHKWAEIRANAEFIADARGDIPALLDEIVRLRAENERLRAYADYDWDVYELHVDDRAEIARLRAEVARLTPAPGPCSAQGGCDCEAGE